ncbi:hypothetical protein DB354_17190 [Opitutus sp. ER46]|nr:hypothetical protein DB354_17190 [Opitutus sp. ER46]
MESPTPRRPLKLAVPFVLQALVWIALTVASAAQVTFGGFEEWPEALRFAAANWLPWALLTPIVVWYSHRFPIERGHLRRSIPAHALGAIACVSLILWMSSTFTFMQRPPRRFGDQRFWPRERGLVISGRAPAPAVPGNPAPAGNATITSANKATDVARPDTSENRADAARPAGPLVGDDTPSAPPFRPEGDAGPGGPPPEGLRLFGPGMPPERFGQRLTFWRLVIGPGGRRANVDAAIYLIIVAAAHALAFYRRAQERDRHAAALAAGLNRAKLDALRLQLQPHFLFNTLNAISTLVHRDADAADNLIGDLSDLLRLSLQTTDHQVPLARELELLGRYLAIEQTRLGDRLRLVREIAPDTAAALVPTFVLQPLVENAIRHGIEPRLAPGTITVQARRVGERLHLSVRDDGVGLGQTGSASRRGIGISNTEARLQALHGDAAQLVISTPAGGGVEVEITLPFSTTPPAPTADVPPAQT